MDLNRRPVYIHRDTESMLIVPEHIDHPPHPDYVECVLLDFFHEESHLTFIVKTMNRGQISRLEY